MKKSNVILIVLAIYFGVMVVSVPSPKKHRQLVKKKMYYKIDESGEGCLVRLLEKGEANLLVDHLTIQNCLVFNLGYYKGKNERKYFSVGAFNQVFVFPSAYKGLK